MKKVLVIGGSGFIGNYIIKECLSRDWIAHNWDKKNNSKVYNLDITKLTPQSFPNFNFCDCDFIYHLAAISDINDCWNKPVEAIDINIGGLCRVLEMIRHYDMSFGYFKRFIYSSSMYVYNTDSGPYGITKRAAEDLIKWYQKEYDINYTILRYGSIYGPGADDNNSMKRLIENALKTGIISYYGTGEEVREYIHVKDLAKITVELSYTTEFKNSTVNLTGQYPMKAKDMCYMIRDILGVEYIVEFKGEKPFNHYAVTPYKYQREVARKYVAQNYYDMGAGLLELITELDK